MHLSDPATAATTGYVLIQLVRAARDIAIVWITANRIEHSRQKTVRKASSRKVPS